MIWFQKTITLQPRKRGFHLITDEIASKISELKKIRVGIAHIFIQHTSASLTINENYDPDVRIDMETHFNKMVPEDVFQYRHTVEGPDDMTSHIKTSMLGSSLLIPITEGKLNLGRWQGIILCEHRNTPHKRNLLVTLIGTE